MHAKTGRGQGAPQSSLRLTAINRGLQRLWATGMARCPDLDPDRMIAHARRRTGLSDFGDPDIWLKQLWLLCEELRQGADLTPLGRTIAQGQIVAILRDRLLAHALWKRVPAIADVPVQAPVIVVGQMRSGTTRMQRLLASDPGNDSTRFFESWNPIPLREGGVVDDRRVRAGVALAAIRTLNPHFAAIHPTAIDAPDEEIGFNSFALFGSAFEAQWRVPRFARYCEERDTTPVYREFRRLLQTVKYLRGRSADRPWVLKLPQMTQDLDAVLRQFPDARLVVLDRDPSQVVGSSASLVENQMRIQSDTVDRQWIGREWLRKSALRQARMDRAVAGFAGPVARVGYGMIEEDWRGTMRDLYRRLRLNWSEATEAAMAAYQAKPAHSGGDRHVYWLDRYGLSGGDVQAAMRPARVPELAA